MKACKLLLDNFAFDQHFMTCPVCRSNNGYYAFTPGGRYPALSQRCKCSECRTSFYWDEPDQPGGMKIKVVYPDGH